MDGMSGGASGLHSQPELSCVFDAEWCDVCSAWFSSIIVRSMVWRAELSESVIDQDIPVQF